MKDPKYRAEYDALEEEFALIGAMMDARARAGLTQAQVAKRMKTTQTVVARLESGRVKPSTRTLERFAHATGHKLIIGFEKAKPRTKAARCSSKPNRLTKSSPTRMLGKSCSRSS